MAVDHIALDEGKFRARRVLDPARKLRDAFSALEDELLAMAKIKDSAGNDAGHFAIVAEMYGVEGADQPAKNANAKKLFDELNSAMANSSALIQLLSLLGA